LKGDKGSKAHSKGGRSSKEHLKGPETRLEEGMRA